MPGYIPDGYTREDGYIAEALPESSGERPYESMSFSYRVATRQEALTLEGSVRIAMKHADIDASCMYKSQKLLWKFVADHVKSWDLLQVKTHPVDVSPEAMEHLHPILFEKLYAIVRGARMSDPKADAKPAKTDAEMVGNSPVVSG